MPQLARSGRLHPPSQSRRLHDLPGGIFRAPRSWVKQSRPKPQLLQRGAQGPGPEAPDADSNANP
jgi:hypothetical protein